LFKLFFQVCSVLVDMDVHINIPQKVLYSGKGFFRFKKWFFLEPLIKGYFKGTKNGYFMALLRTPLFGFGLE